VKDSERLFKVSLYLCLKTLKEKTSVKAEDTFEKPNSVMIQVIQDLGSKIV